jgi:hypothetical protein
MRRAAATLALALLAALPAMADGQPPRSVPRDAEQHIAAGVAASMAAAGLFTILAPGRRDGIATAAVAGLAAALAAGAAKEVADSLGLGTPELRDFVGTAAGGLVGATVAFLALAGGRSGMAGALIEGAALTAAVVLVRVTFPAIGNATTGTAAPQR